MRLSHQALILFWGRLSSQLSVIVRAMVLSRMMPYEEYGAYGQAMMFGALVTPYLVMGLDVAIPFFFARLPDDKQKGLIALVCGYLSLAGVLTATVLFLGSPVIAEWAGSTRLETNLKYYAFVVAFMQLPVIVPPSLLSKKRPFLAGIYGPSMEIPGAIAVVLTFYWTRNVNHVFLVLAFMRALHCIAGVYLTVHLPFREISAAIDRAMVKDVLKYALPLGVSAIIGQTSLAIDKLFISYYFSDADFAIYRNGSMEIPVFMLITASIFAVLLPEMARLVHAGDGRAAIRLWREGVRRCAMITIPVIVFSFVFAGDLIRVLFSSRYAESVPVFQIYTASLFIRVAQYGCVFVVFNRPRLILAISAISLFINLIAAFLFIKLFPAIGLDMFLAPCSAALVTRYLRVGATIGVIALISGIRFTQVMPWGPIGRFLGCSVAGCAIVYPLLWVPALDSEGLRVVRLILAVVGSFSGFLIAAWFTRSIVQSDLDFVLRPIENRWRAWRKGSRGKE